LKAVQRSETLSAWQTRADHHFRLLYGFYGSPDGSTPEAALVAMNGVLYGTTSAGGEYGAQSRNGYGTVFEIDATGHESVLYSFKGGRDGASPVGALTVMNGRLYGTTTFDEPQEDCFEGSWPLCGNGTVFELNLSGKERVLYHFKGGKDGSNPFGGLVAVHGILYGTTLSGGCCVKGAPTDGDGTVFEVTTSGSERVIYRFGGQPGDGAHPMASLIAATGKLYGSTTSGGSHNLGTVFEVTASGEERVLHSFAGCPADGAIPQDGVTALNGFFYGTTLEGGTGSPSGCGEPAVGAGVVYEVNRSGDERVLYSFPIGGVDNQPIGGLLALNDKLYGTTRNDVFEISTSGQQHALVQEVAGSQARLIVMNEKLYGTTLGGGATNNGAVFELTP
jgi:uncharacterized repeat protein (TIGR03803 family)